MISSSGRSPFAIIDIAFGHMFGPKCPPFIVNSFVSPITLTVTLIHNIFEKYTYDTPITCNFSSKYRVFNKPSHS